MSVKNILANTYGIEWHGSDRPISPDYFVIHENKSKQELCELIDNMRKAQFTLAAGFFQGFYWLCYADKEIE